MNLKISKLTSIDKDTLKTISTWMYNWWGKHEGYSYPAVESYMKHSAQKKRLPITYGLFLDEKIIGLYQFRQEDLFARPDIYPWLANVYIDKAFRGKGYGKIMMESVKENAQKNLDFNEVFLFTVHSGLYEIFGWEFVDEIDTFLENVRIQRLYKLKIK